MQHAANRNTLILMKHQMWMNTLLKIVPGTISSCLLKTENFYMLSSASYDYAKLANFSYCQ